MKLKEIREMYPEGTQIVLTEMAGERQMPYGLKGTVKFVDDAGQIHMSWENGSSLALNINEDTFEKVEAPEKISVVLVEPGRYPKLIEIEDTLEAMQSLVEGDIEEYMPFEDEVAIICNEEGKMNGMPLNRAVYSEPENVEMLSLIHIYASARESTLTAFYTPPEVSTAIYKVLEQMGFQEGNLLEPSCGIGNFIGMLPKSMENAKVYGVEDVYKRQVSVMWLMKST